MNEQKKILWVPEFLRDSQRARVGLGVLVEPGQEPVRWVEFRVLWEDKLRKVWEEDEDPLGAELIQVWEELEGACAWCGISEIC